MGALDVTNRFVLDFASRYARDHPGAKMLDFGCGAGRLVTAARAAGLDMYGADVFYGGSAARLDAERAGLLGTVVTEIRENRISLPDARFGLIVNNQVMEHVEDLDATLAELHRVLKPGGTLLSIFPSRDVFREGHIGIPFSHWFPKDSRLRFYYAWALRSLGFGIWKEQAPTARQWAIDKLQWIDTYTRYRSRSEILGTYARYFTSELREPEYIRYRLLDRPGRLRAMLARCLDVPGVPAVASAIFRKLAFLVIVSRKGPR